MSSRRSYECSHDLKEVSAMVEAGEAVLAGLAVEDREEIERMIGVLQWSCRRLGRQGAIELLIKLSDRLVVRR